MAAADSMQLREVEGRIYRRRVVWEQRDNFGVFREVAAARCERCPREDPFMLGQEAHRYFVEHGWTFRGTTLLCPDCSAKDCSGPGRHKGPFVRIPKTHQAERCEACGVTIGK